MTLLTTPFAAAVLVFLYVRLTLGVVKIRRRDSVSLGDAGNESLQKAIRAHGNLTEWAPLALILLAILEINGAPIWLSASLAIVFVLGRIFHSQGITSSDSDALKKRVLGMRMTISSVIFMTVVNILVVIYSLVVG